jgi:acyl dehydratase
MHVILDVGARHGPFSGRLDPQHIASYAAATNDDAPDVRDGVAVPATYPVILVFDAQAAANRDVLSVVSQHARGGVHGEHDIVLHRPLVPGEAITTWAALSAVRTTRVGARVVLHLQQYDERDTLVAEQWWTTLFLGADVLADVGPEPPGHSFPDAARREPVGSAMQWVGNDVAHRYAKVSGDWSAHHFDREAARASGFDDVFAHGLCTMGMCTQAAVALVAGGDPRRVRRVAVRFAAPMPLGADLTVDVFAAGAGTYAFEASCSRPGADRTTVITHGRLELRDEP